jgi:integrase
MVDVRTKGGKRVDQTWNKWERLSSHAARRSFATKFFLQGIPAGVLMQITGHSTEKQFMQYINVDPKANAVRFADLVQGIGEGQ